MRSRTGRGPSGVPHGFTAIELLLVVVIMGLLMGIAVPVFERTVARANLVSSARQMAADLRMQQQAAINAEDDQNTYQVVFDLDNNRYYLQKNNQIMTIVYLPGTVQIASSNFPGQSNCLRFNIQGRPRDGGGTITLRCKTGDLYYVIVAAITGRVRISEEPPEGSD